MHHRWLRRNYYGAQGSAQVLVLVTVYIALFGDDYICTFILHMEINKSKDITSYKGKSWITY